MAKWDHYRRIRADPADWFDPVEIEKARAYNRGLQWNRVVTLCLAFVWLVGWIAGRVAHRVVERVGVRNWAFQVLLINVLPASRFSRFHSTSCEIGTGSAGDGFLFVFEDAGDALLCAIDVQRALERYGKEHDEEIRVRMGLHTGDVIRKGDSVIGREVHLAARISAAARGGQILVSGDVREALEDTGRFRFSDDRELELKGLSGTHRVSEVDWRETALSPDPSRVRVG